MADAVRRARVGKRPDHASTHRYLADALLQVGRMDESAITRCDTANDAAESVRLTASARRPPDSVY